MPDKSVFLNFIAYCVESFYPTDITPTEWRKILKKAKLDDLEELKSMAMKLYFIRIIISNECIGAKALLEMDSDNLKNYVIATDNHRKEYKLANKPIIFYTVDKMITKDIKTMQGNPLSIEKMIKVEKKSKTTKKSPTKVRKTITTGTRKTSKDSSTKVRKTIKKSNNGDKSPVESPKAKKVAAKNKKESSSDESRSPKKKSNKRSVEDIKKYKNCSRYTIAQLRKMAKDAGVTIPEGLKKDEICEIVKEEGLLDIVITVKNDDSLAKKYRADRYIFDTEDPSLIIGIKASGKYAPLTVEDRNLLVRLKKPFKFVTNKEIERQYFFADLSPSKILYNHLGNTDKNHMIHPPVPIKDRAPKKKPISPSILEARKRAKNATKNALLESKFENRQLIPKRV